MYRCLTATLGATITIAASLACLSASAQLARHFPATALRGTLAIGNPPEATLNGAAARLGAGARLRGSDNLLKMPATLAGQKFLVHYTLDPQGLLQDVWILRPDEAARKPWPTTPQQASDWRFDPVAQVWTRP